MSTPAAPIHPELDIYKLLEEVYDQGYNAGDGFKQPGLLSDFLYEKKLAIQAWSDHRSNEARLSELGDVQLEYGHYVAQTFVNGKWMSVQERYDQLKSLTPSNPKEEL